MHHKVTNFFSVKLIFISEAKIRFEISRTKRTRKNSLDEYHSSSLDWAYTCIGANSLSRFSRFNKANCCGVSPLLLNSSKSWSERYGRVFKICCSALILSGGGLKAMKYSSQVLQQNHLWTSRIPRACVFLLSTSQLSTFIWEISSKWWKCRRLLLMELLCWKR